MQLSVWQIIQHPIQHDSNKPPRIVLDSFRPFSKKKKRQKNDFLRHGRGDRCRSYTYTFLPFAFFNRMKKRFQVIAFRFISESACFRLSNSSIERPGVDSSQSLFACPNRFVFSFLQRFNRSPFFYFLLLLQKWRVFGSCAQLNDQRIANETFDEKKNILWREKN